MKMNISAVLLCVLLNQVIGEDKDISTAQIFSRKKTISENDDLDLTCSTFGKNKSSNIYIYLLKDGAVFKRTELGHHQDDFTFKLSRVGLNYSGNYSCCFSSHAYEPSAVAERGYNTVEIQVIANFLPADISMVGPSTVTEGDEVEFKCSISDALYTLDKCQLIQSYLMMNETVLQVKAFDVSVSEASFTIKEAVGRDSGHYSCLLLPSTCIQEEHPHRKNEVFLEVKVPLMRRVIVYGGLTTILLLLGLHVCWILDKGLRVSCKPRSTTEPADVLEQTEAEKDEEDSFNMEEEEDEEEEREEEREERPNVDLEADYAVLPSEDIYSNPDEPPEGPACVLYASSVRRHNYQLRRSSESNT